jgi:bacterioferritin (cytochrome b1)
MQDNMLDALKALIRLELKVGELYEACALQWPEDAPFWLGVARQEAGHARAIERMVLLISKNPAHFLPAKAIKVEAVETIIAGIERTTNQVRNGRLLKNNLMAIAVDIENSVMEKKFFEMIKTADPVFLELCHDIMAQTKEHKQRFEKRLAELKAALKT